jgi:dienelactone hydrolase
MKKINYKDKPHNVKSREKDNTARMAAFAEAAYKPTDKEKLAYLKSLGINRVSIDKEFSTPESTVFKYNNKVVVSSRGTTLGQGFGTAVKDLSTDILVGLGAAKFSNREKEFERTASAVAGKYGKKNVVLTGHSLGGTIAKLTAEKEGLTAHVFNPGAGVDDYAKVMPTAAIAGMVKGKMSAAEGTQIHQHTTVWDPVSTGGLFDRGSHVKHHLYTSTADNPHTIDNYTSHLKKKSAVKRKRMGNSKSSSKRQRADHTDIDE